jgi:hypothetical protein
LSFRTSSRYVYNLYLEVWREDFGVCVWGVFFSLVMVNVFVGIFTSIQASPIFDVSGPDVGT